MSIYKIKKTDIFIHLLFIFIIFPWNLTGQYVSHRDSFSGLYKRALRLNNDSLKLKYLHLLAQAYMYANPDSLKILSDSLLSMATSLHSDKYTGIAYKLLGNYYSVNFRMDSARYYFKKSLQFSEKAGDSMTLALILVGMGNSYTDYVPDSALFYFKKALEINKSIDNQDVFFITYYNLGVLMNNHEKPQKAMDYFLLAAKYADSIHYVKYHGYVYNNLGMLVLNYLKDTLKARQYFEIGLKDFEQIKDLRGQSLIYESLANFVTEKAIHYSLKALALSKQVGDKGNITVFSHNIGMRYLDRNQPDSAEFYLRQSVSLAKKYGFQDLLLQSYRELGRAYMLKKEWKKAKEYLEKSWQLAQKDTVLEYKIQALYYLSDWAKATQNFKQAYDYYTRADSLESIRDSLVNVKAIKEVETQYQTEKKERENLQLKKEKAEQALLIQRQKQRNRMLVAASAGTLLLSGVFMFFWVRIRRRNAEIRRLHRILAHRTKGYLEKINDFIDYIKEFIERTQATPDQVKIKIEELKSRIMTIIRAHELIMSGHGRDGKINLNEYVNTLVNELRSMLKDKSIAIRTDIAPDLYLDGNQVLPVGLIVDEFVMNSSKYAFDKNHPSPEISIRSYEETGRLILEMQDNGRGGDVKNIQGSGFGLLLLEKIIHKQLKGKMEIDGTKGFRLRVEIPFVKNYTERTTEQTKTHPI